MIQDPSNAQDFGSISISRVHMPISWPTMRSIHRAQWNTSWPHHIWSVAHSYGLPEQSYQMWASSTEIPMRVEQPVLWDPGVHILGKTRSHHLKHGLITAGPCHVCSWLGSLAALQWQQTAGQYNWLQEGANPLCSNSWMPHTNAILRIKRKKAKDFICSDSAASFYAQKATCWLRDTAEL